MKKANHLLNTLKDKYKISTDWTASTYIGINLKWDYNVRTVTLSTTNYVQNALLKFQHDCPSQPEHNPHMHNVLNYGVKVQYDTRDKNTEHFYDTERNVIQKLVGAFLYYGIDTDNTIITALSDIAAEQLKKLKI